MIERLGSGKLDLQGVRDKKDGGMDMSIAPSLRRALWHITPLDTNPNHHWEEVEYYLVGGITPLVKYKKHIPNDPSSVDKIWREANGLELTGLAIAARRDLGRRAIAGEIEEFVRERLTEQITVWLGYLGQVGASEAVDVPRR